MYKELPKTYLPSQYEDEIYKLWEKKGLFNPDVVKNSGEHFSIVLPPPNVTGTLHLGHASMLAIEDLLVRFNRMRGRDTLWVPGTDHAAIATQNVVEKKLFNEEGKRRSDLGREKFLAKVESFVRESKETIKKQTKKMGASLDWSREAYTLDPVRSQAVRQVFKQMYDDGLIYRGYRIVHWCPRCHTTLADDEVVYKQEKGKLYWIKYGPFTLATTRPETKLGDTAVAVNPNDSRYKDMVGKRYMIPGVLGEFEVEVVADEIVDPEFGSGAVKVTPAHSFDDYGIAERHHLPMKKIIDEDGRMMDNCGKYAGLTTLEAREAIVADMTAMGLIDHIDEDYPLNLSLCYRCKTAIEPIPSDQWFVSVNKNFTIKNAELSKLLGRSEISLKELSLEVVRNKSIDIIPERFEKNYFHWMENLHDWCISRQIWFGHRVPVWYCRDCKETIVRADKPTEIVFLRHAEALSNVTDRLNSDSTNLSNKLTEHGLAQVDELTTEFPSEGITRIITSPMTRARETAERLATAWQLEIEEDARLVEVGVGDFEGRSDAEMSKFRRENFTAWENDSPHNLESFNHLKSRAHEFMAEIAHKYPGEKILVVTHGDVIRVAQGYHKNLTNQQIFDLGFPRNAEQITLRVNNVKCACGSINVYQDDDTLDTWFSSGLWTFTSMLPADWAGGPFDSPDIKRFHPTTVLETGYDILFFWVARMILMTTYVRGEVPFKTVYLHGLIRDKDGEKMSKSKPEKAIDPLVVGEKYGFDAVRLSLLIGNTAGSDIRLFDEKIEGFRNFVNKLWNISRYILMSVTDVSSEFSVENLSVADRYILSRFNRLKTEITTLFEAYNFSQAGELLREFTWSEFADWYLEVAKIEKGKDPILMSILKELLALWHPFVPFVTETIWRELATDKELIVSSWPSVVEELIDSTAEAKFQQIMDIVARVRNLRSEFKLDPITKVNLAIKQSAEDKFLADNLEVLQTLGRISGVEFVVEKPNKSVLAVCGQLEIYLLLDGLIDFDKEIERLQKDLVEARKYQKTLEVKLNNAEFTAHAPAEIVSAERSKLESTLQLIEKIEIQIKELS